MRFFQNLAQAAQDAMKRRVRLRKYDRGVSAIEFALIAPLMVVMLFGAAEISFAITVDRKTTLAASTLGDLAAQTDLVSCAELGQIGSVTKMVFEPYSGDNATMVVANLVLVGSAAQVEWSRYLRTDATGVLTCETVPTSHALAQGKTVPIDTSLFAPGGGIVVGDIEMVHRSLGTQFIRNDLKLGERFYLRPRKSLKLKLCTQTGPSVTAANCTATT